MVNKIYVDKKVIVENDYKDIVTSYFHSEIENVDLFNERQKVVKSANNWCEKKTFGKINDILSTGLFISFIKFCSVIFYFINFYIIFSDDIKEDTMMILLNAIYFKDFWEDQFSPCETKLKSWYPLDYNTIEVPTMKQFIYTYYKELKDIDADCIILPYKV